MSRLLAALHDVSVRALFGKETPTLKETFYDCADRLMDGKEVDMSAYKGSVVCLVNVASK
jgi:hypothetical protein